MKTFGTFLIAFFCCVNNSFGQNNVTIRQVYDFEVGDVFYYKYEGWNTHNILDETKPSFLKRTVIDKKTSKNNDTILYTFIDYRYSKGIKNGHDTIVYELTNKTSEITNLDSSILKAYKSSEYEFDTISLENRVYDPLCSINAVRYYGTTLIHVPAAHQEIFYGVGLGELSNLYYFDDSREEKITLFSYIKKNSQCGTPEVLLTDESIRMENDITVYPNPVQNTLYVNVDVNLFSQYQLLNQAGQVVLSGTIKTEKLTVDVAKLSTGVYNLKLIGNNSSAQKTIIKQ